MATTTLATTGRGVQAYQAVHVQSRSPLEPVVMLFAGALRFLQQARDAQARGDVRTRAHGVSRALAIVGELQNTLNMDEGGALATLETVLKGAGFTVHRMTFSEPGTADVENLYARIGTASPHLMFAGHTDVVPPGEASAWSHDAFAGDVADGLLYGRGAVDMKGGIACAVAATLDYLAANEGMPKGPISFLITGDEEDVAVNGTVKLLQWAAERGERFDHCVVGEPSNVEAIARKTMIWRHC